MLRIGNSTPAAHREHNHNTSHPTSLRRATVKLLLRWQRSRVFKQARPPMTCSVSSSDEKIKICVIYGHVNFTLSHASEHSLSRVQQEIERTIATETTLNGSWKKSFAPSLLKSAKLWVKNSVMWRKKCHSFLKVCKFWETSIRVSPIVYQHKIFVLSASRGFEAPIARSLAWSLLLPS